MEQTKENSPVSLEEFKIAYEKQQKLLEDQATHNAKQQKQIEEQAAYIDGLHRSIGNVHLEHHERMSIHFTMQDITNHYETFESIFRDIQIGFVRGPDLPAIGRNVLKGSGTARFGIIEKIADVITSNPQFVPANMTQAGLMADKAKFEMVQNFSITAGQMNRLIKDIQLVLGDSMYRQAMSYYGAVRDAAKRRAPGAQFLYNNLQQYFIKNRSQQQPEEDSE